VAEVDGNESLKARKDSQGVVDFPSHSATPARLTAEAGIGHVYFGD